MAAPDVDQLRREFGGPAAVATIAAYCARGPQAVGELFAALTTPYPADTPDRDGRAVFEDEGLCLHRLAIAYPQEFVAQVHAHPTSGAREGVLAALEHVPGDAAEQLLFAALDARGGWQRWLALRGLIARGCAAVLPRLAKLLRDRDTTVRFTALAGLRRWGRGEHVPALLAYIAKAPPGGVEFGLDAIEEICARGGLALPPAHPGPRLERVTVAGAAASLAVIVASRVQAGERLAHVDGAAVRSPCAGVVSAIDEEPGRLSIVLRRDPAGPG